MQGRPNRRVLVIEDDNDTRRDRQPCGCRVCVREAVRGGRACRRGGARGPELIGSL